MKTDTPIQPLLSTAQREQFIRDGYLRVSGLIPSDVVQAAREGLLDRMGIHPDNPDTWTGKAMSTDPDVIALTEACRTPGIEAAASELVGPGFLPGVTYSPFLNSRGVSPAVLRGFIPVPPALAYADPVPLPGKAGDVIFMHYLLVHSGSANHAAHIRVGLNTAVMPDPEHPYQSKRGIPQPDWTPLDRTLRTDTLGSVA